jgi:hypothetical protein
MMCLSFDIDHLYVFEPDILSGDFGHGEAIVNHFIDATSHLPASIPTVVL